jgi:hypothetical protein
MHIRHCQYVHFIVPPGKFMELLCMYDPSPRMTTHPVCSLTLTRTLAHTNTAHAHAHAHPRTHTHHLCRAFSELLSAAMHISFLRQLPDAMHVLLKLRKCTHCLNQSRKQFEIRNSKFVFLFSTFYFYFIRSCASSFTFCCSSSRVFFDR